jgi:hypothetical protein
MTCDGVELEDENLDVDLDNGLSAVNEQEPVLLPSVAWPFPSTKQLDDKAVWPFPSEPNP